MPTHEVVSSLWAKSPGRRTEVKLGVLEHLLLVAPPALLSCWNWSRLL